MPEEKSKVDQLSDTLYSRTRYQDPLDKRSVLKEGGVLDSATVEEKWQGPALDEMLTHEHKPVEVTPFMKKFFVFAILFFAAAMGVAGFVFFGGGNFISSKNVDITVVGPTAASAGEVLELAVTIENKNNADLELTNLSIQYPAGSRDPSDSSKNLTYTREELGVIKAGDEAVRNVKFILLGSSGEAKELKFSVEYKVKGSSATFYKDKLYPLTIGESPLSLSVDSPVSVTSGEDFTTTLTVDLNSTEVLKNVVLKAEYPYGYSVVSSNPTALLDGNVWALGDLSPGSSKRIQVTGRLVGENQDERTFRYYLGVADAHSLSPSVKTVILSAQETVAIQRPSVGLSVMFNGENALVYVAPAERPVLAQVRFQNNLSEKLLNPKLEVRLTGTSLNRSTIVAQAGGVYNSSTGKINWNLINSSSNQAELSPGDDGSVSFSFASLPESLNSANQDIGVQIIFSGTPAGTSQPITVTETRTVKVAAKVTLSARAVYSLGPFVNSGPIPPKVDQDTTYTVILSVGNTQSDLNNTYLTARLGSKVTWLAAQEVEGEKIIYDEQTNTVTWDLGPLSSGLGFSSAARQAAFQVALKPAASQIGTTPTLLSSILFSGADNASGKMITISAPNLTTKLLTDPAFIQGDDIVVK